MLVVVVEGRFAWLKVDLCKFRAYSTVLIGLRRRIGRTGLDGCRGQGFEGFVVYRFEGLRDWRQGHLGSWLRGLGCRDSGLRGSGS